MKPNVITFAAMLAISNVSLVSAQSLPQTTSPTSRSNPAELPKVFAVKIHVADLARSAQFYHDVFDAKTLTIHAHETMVQLKTGLGIVLIQRSPDAAASSDGAGGLIIQVADIEAAVARVKTAGGVVERPPNDGKGKESFSTRSAIVRDLDGVNIELIQFPAT